MYQPVGDQLTRLRAQLLVDGSAVCGAERERGHAALKPIETIRMMRDKHKRLHIMLTYSTSECLVHEVQQYLTSNRCCIDHRWETHRISESHLTGVQLGNGLGQGGRVIRALSVQGNRWKWPGAEPHCFAQRPRSNKGTTGLLHLAHQLAHRLGALE